MSVGIDYPSTMPMADEEEPIAPPGRRNYRPGPPDDVFIPVAPMLDMAFQLLAFFILTFKPPTAEMHVDLYLPVAAVAMPTKPEGRARPDSARVEAELENDLQIRAEADELGDLKALKLGDAPISGSVSSAAGISCVLCRGKSCIIP